MSSSVSPSRRRTGRTGRADRGRKADTNFVWADVVGVAGSNARLVGRYLAFMAVAGVIGCYGVIDRNPLLLVGAMAVSP